MNTTPATITTHAATWLSRLGPSYRADGGRAGGGPTGRLSEATVVAFLKHWTLVGTYEGAAYAAVNVDGGALQYALNRYIELHNPGLTNIRLITVTWTESVNTRIRPHQRRYEVTYWADEKQPAT